MIDRPDVCLVAPGHLASTPRAVKHADALAAAGYRVHVISGWHFPPAEPLDAAILAAGKWGSTRIDFRSGWRGLSARLVQKISRSQFRSAASSWKLAARALHPGHIALAMGAVRTGAKFFYGHGGVAGLAAAASAAKLSNGAFGFDAEDWHEEETDSLHRDATRLAAIRTLLRSLLSEARLLTCAAPLISDAYASAYGVRAVCLLNVFPCAEAPAAPRAPAPPSVARPAVLYWFSQTIGPGRGLEQMARILAHMRTPAALHLRGFFNADYLDVLRTHAGAASDRIVPLPPAPSSEMARLTSGAHLGLSLEQSTPRNRDLCLTNKIFTYLLAGVPVALTPTTAQKALAPELGKAALPLDIDDPENAAKRLDEWLARDFAGASAHAWRLGQERFNWDRESAKLLDLFRQTIGAPE